MPVSARRPGSLPRLPDTDAGGAIVCVICQAVYAPSRSYEYLLQAPSIVLESAFMSICHFCFRCRRPSCPSCWDDVHGVCGQCAEETNLPFRLEVAPLNGVQFVPSRQNVPEQMRASQSSLINVHPGRFEVLSIENVTTRPDTFLALETQRASSEEGVAESILFDIDTIKTRPTIGSEGYDASPPSDIDEVKKHSEHIGHRRLEVGRVLITVTFALFALFVLLIIVALLWSDANIFIFKFLRVDIRAEIAYLWHLLQQLF